jgi:hypothetical protein
MKGFHTTAFFISSGASHFGLRRELFGQVRKKRRCEGVVDVYVAVDATLGVGSSIIRTELNGSVE